MSNKAKRKSKKKKHLSAKPYFSGLVGENMPHGSGFSPNNTKGGKPIVRRTTSK